MVEKHEESHGGGGGDGGEALQCAAVIAKLPVPPITGLKMHHQSQTFCWGTTEEVLSPPIWMKSATRQPEPRKAH